MPYADPAVSRPGKTVVVTTTPSDSHTWNLVFLQLLLEESGYAVRNLGACTPTETVLAACRGPGVDLLVVSSVNGHGSVEGAALIRVLRADPALAGLPAVIGGMLTTADGYGVAAELSAAGYDAVFLGESAAERFRSFIAARTVFAGARTW